MITERQKEIVVEVLQSLAPIKIGVFGSYARGEQKELSDLDILLFLDDANRISLLELIGAEQNLSDALGIKVDLVTDRSLNPYLRPFIEKDVQIIYG